MSLYDLGEVPRYSESDQLAFILEYQENGSHAALERFICSFMPMILMACSNLHLVAQQDFSDAVNDCVVYLIERMDDYDHELSDVRCWARSMIHFGVMKHWRCRAGAAVRPVQFEEGQDHLVPDRNANWLADIEDQDEHGDQDERFIADDEIRILNRLSRILSEFGLNMDSLNVFLNQVRERIPEGVEHMFGQLKLSKTGRQNR